MTQQQQIAKLYIEMNSSTFQNGKNGTELARILRKQADAVDNQDLSADGWEKRSLNDSNGTNVGSFEVVTATGKVATASR